MKIVCLSDLHLDDTFNTYGNSPSAQVTESVGYKDLNLLVNAMEYTFKNDKIDLLVFLGDYVQGRNSEDNKQKCYSEFLHFLNQLESKDIFNHNDFRQHTIILPGNHDIDRKKADPLSNFKEKMNAYLNPFREKLSKNTLLKYAPLFIFEDLRLIVDCESTVNHSSTEVTDIDAIIKKLEKESFGSKGEILAKLNEFLIKDIPTVPHVSKESFIKSNKEIEDESKYKSYYKLILSHHPLLSGNEDNITFKEYNNTVGGYGLINTAINFDYTYFIHGHIHEFSCLEFKEHNLSSSKSFQIGIPSYKQETKIVVCDLFENKSENKIRSMKLDKHSVSFREDKLILNDTVSESKYLNILVDYEIEQLIQEGYVIKNADSSHVEAASYDCSLGYSYKKALKNNFQNWKDSPLLTIQSVDYKPAQISIEPNETILIYTFEEFNIPPNMILHASPISSWARKGLRVEISFFIDPGFKGPFCFPVTNETSETITINARESIISIEFMCHAKTPNKTWDIRHKDKQEDRLAKRE